MRKAEEGEGRPEIGVQVPCRRIFWSSPNTPRVTLSRNILGIPITEPSRDKIYIH